MSLITGSDGIVRTLSGSHVIIPNYYKLNDSELKAEAKKQPNGGYVKQICKNCGSYIVDQYSNTNDAVIVSHCRICII